MEKDFYFGSESYGLVSEVIILYAVQRSIPGGMNYI